MKKNGLCRLLAVFLFSVVFAVTAQAEEKRLFDDAGYFSAEEAAELNSLLLKTEAETGFFVSVLVADNIGGDKSDYGARDYADVYYEQQFGVDTDGIIYMLNLDTKTDIISTSGSYVIPLFTDYRIESVFDYLWDEILDEDYYDAMVKFCAQVRYYDSIGLVSDSGVFEKESDYHYSYREEESFDMYAAQRGALGGAVAGVIISVIILVTVHSKYKIKRAKGARNYLDEKTVRYHQKSDTFIRSYVTAHRIESSSGGSRGSSTHRSSGGGTHGGGGRSR